VLYVIFCDVCYCIVLYCPVLHCSTLPPGINPFAFVIIIIITIIIRRLTCNCQFNFVFFRQGIPVVF
jgi:hypothetical protein